MSEIQSQDGSAVAVASTETFRKLKARFSKRGYEYRLVKRSDEVAMYEQWADERLHAYEVFRVQVNDARVIAGRAVSAGESSPGDEQWGKKGWTCLTRESAEQRYEAAQALVDEAAEAADEGVDEVDDSEEE
jgi:hypothetical protein